MKANLQIKPTHSLDTLETSSDYYRNKTHERQYYKAIRKDKTNSKILSIIDSIPDNETAQKRYWNTYHCQDVIIQQSDKFKGSLCRKRWCTECCRIKTAEMTNGYKQPMLDLGQLYFVTLTTPNVSGSNLKKEIQKMIDVFYLIKDNLRKTYKIKLNGIRKIEVTYNEKTNEYHPHFHLIQDNLEASNLVLNLWLKHFKKASIKGQDIRRIDTTNETAFIELFKYATKETNSKGQQYDGEVLHTIYSSIGSKRIYQTYGNIRKIPKPKTPTENEMEIDYVPEQNNIWYYEKSAIDWVTFDNQLLINTLEIKHKIETQKLISLSNKLITESYAEKSQKQSNSTKHQIN
jgi:plasmid rolling circle replication initiator protein Rep